MSAIKKLFSSLNFGISAKLFLTFWFVVICSISISYVITLQLQHRPTQGVATPKQLHLLNQYATQQNKKIIKLANKEKKFNLKSLRNQFERKYQQHLLIKDLATNKVYLPRHRAWQGIEKYLSINSLPNPVTIDFAYTQVTGAKEITVNNKSYQLFVAGPIDRQQFHSIIEHLPLSVKMMISLIISAFLCWLLAKAFSKPLIAIQKASDNLGKGNLSTRLIGFDERSDEFGAVARSFNKMASQLEDNITAHQRLLGDVSHELRSPLARLQLAIGLVEQNIGNTEEQQRHLNRCENEVDRLDTMIGDVLTLSRLEHTNTTDHFESIQLVNLTQQVVDDCQYIANTKNVIITLASDEKYSLNGDKKLLISAISNVLNNAVKYAPEHSTVSVELTLVTEKICLTVTDQGTGVPDNMLSKLFTPFFRVADARDRNSGGTGLGLAIAQQAIKQHQGEIYAQNTQPCGLMVSIVLPLQS
ncbi:HAMP domain-containing protein [Colwellia sp. D2M02]|uniref:ATP-binding protein n=1 Tax=Colwellia sp. D2M02 TaxID=2841562 RepID=UPI001C08AB94|nr:ATP-binding protein [Colwellia sp. D2M02]MBU2894522.1 HAMP domain-containing protein [Colwellia sp. D2M02]